MGITRNLIVLSLVALLGGILLDKYAPHYTSPLKKNPAVQDTINLLKKYISLIYPLDVKKQFGNSGEILFTADELKEYTGKEGDKGLYLSYLGVVYDVAKGNQYYGPNGSYSFFAGRDGTRAYVTGDFTEEGLTDDLSDLSYLNYLGIMEWEKLYKKDYKAVGKLIGRYYDENGDPTPYYAEVKTWFNEAKEEKNNEEKEKEQFPPCNSEYNMEIGSRVYCTNLSGGVERDWVGVPRKLFILGSKRERCACVKNFGASATASKGNSSEEDQKSGRGDLDHPNLREYPGCDPDADSCDLGQINDS